MDVHGKHVIAKIKSIEGEVTAVSPDGTKRLLKAGDFIYSDEVIDTSKGKIFLVHDGELVLQNDIAAILGQEALSTEQKAKVDKLLKELEEQDASFITKAPKEKIAASVSGEAGQDKHEPPFIVNHDAGEDLGVHAKAQVLVSLEPLEAFVPSVFSGNFVLPEPAFIPSFSAATPLELKATTLDQLDVTQIPLNDQADYFGVLSANNNVVIQDIHASFDVFMSSHPDAVLAITVTGNIADYNAAPLEFPAPLILPFGLSIQPWAVIAGNTPDTVSYLYRKADLNLLNATQDLDSAQILLDSANNKITAVQDLKDLINQQISGISDLNLDQFEVKANLNTQFAVFDASRSQLVQDINLLTTQKSVAESNLSQWNTTVHNFGITINNGNSITNAGAISELEAKWKALGGTAETMPSMLEGLYAERAGYEQAVNYLNIEIMAKQNLLTFLVEDVIQPLIEMINYDPTSDANLKDFLSHTEELLSIRETLAEGYKSSLINSLNAFDLVLRTGLTNDIDFAYKTQILLMSDTGNNILNPTILNELFTQNGNFINVDALASGLKVDLNGQLSSDQILTVESHFGGLKTDITFHVDIKFANPSADENIHISIPGIPGLNWNSVPPPVLPAGWVLHADNSLTLDLPAIANSVRSPVNDTFTLSFDTALLRNIDLNSANFKIVVNSQVIPLGDAEANVSNNTLQQNFNFNVLGEFPPRALYMVENVSQNDALSDPIKHVEIDIKSLLDNIAVYLNLLSGSTETNFLNNTRVEFRFFNVDQAEPPKVLLSSGVPDPSIDFVKVGDSWVLTGQALKNYVEAWMAAAPADKAYYEHPWIIAAPYGADDLAVKVSGLINGSSEIVVQPYVPIIIDAVAQPIISGGFALGTATFEVSNTTVTAQHDLSFTLKVNVNSPNGDGTENKIIDINLTQAFNPVVALGFTPDWMVLNNNNIWHTEVVGTDVHLIGNLTNVPGITSSDVSLGFNIPTSLVTQSILDTFTTQVQNNIDYAIEHPLSGNLTIASFWMELVGSQTYSVVTSFYPGVVDQLTIDLTHVFGDHLPAGFSANWSVTELPVSTGTIGNWSIQYVGSQTLLVGTNLSGQGSGSVNLELDFSKVAVNSAAIEDYIYNNIFPSIVSGSFDPNDATVKTIDTSFHSNIDLSNVHFDSTHTIFTLTVNMVAPDGDGSEARLIDINLTNVLQFDQNRMPPAGIDPNWTVLSNNGVWHIEKIGSEIHLLGDLEGVVGNNISTSLNLAFNSAVLQYLPKDVNGNYQISIGGPSFNVPGDNSASVVSHEVLDPNEQDFNLTNDTSVAVYLPAGTSVEVPAATVILQEAQVDVAHLTPGVDAFKIDISKALDTFIANLGTDEFNYYAPPDSPSITISVNGVVDSQFTITDDVLYNKVIAYVNATTAAEKAAASTMLYYIGQYNTAIQEIEVDYNLGIYGGFNTGVVLPPTTVIFDAVGSGTEIPVFTPQGYSAGSISSVSMLTLDFAVTAHDMTDETVVVTIQLPHAPDGSVLVAGAPAGLAFGWQLDPTSSGAGSPWSLNGDTITGTFDLSALGTLDIASTLHLDFNTSVLQYLNNAVVGNNIISFAYSIHSVDASSPNNYITSDNQSSDISGNIQVVLTQNENVLVYQNVIGSYPQTYLGNLPTVPDANINLGDGAFDFNAANAARMSTMLHVTIGFEDPDPNLTRTVAIFLPKTGDNFSAVDQQKYLDWKLLPGDENGWSIDTSYNSTTDIKLVKTFAGGSDALLTGNIDDYVPVSFLMTAVGSFDQRELTANGPSPIIPQEMGVEVQISTTTQVDIGGGQFSIETTSTPIMMTVPNITVPSFVMTDAKTPTFTSGNDFYYIEHPSNDLSRVETGLSIPHPTVTITEHLDPFMYSFQQFNAGLINNYINSIKAGTPQNTYSSSIDALLLTIGGGIDVPANTDYSTLVLTLSPVTSTPQVTLNYLLNLPNISNPIPVEHTVTYDINLTSTYTLADAQNDIFLVNFLSGNTVIFNDINAALLRLSPNFSTLIQENGTNFVFYSTMNATSGTRYSETVTYSYSTFSGDVVTELGIGHTFNPGSGDDTVIGSDGRDIFNSSQFDFTTTTTGGVATNTENTTNLGNDTFIGGLGRDWIESGAGNDVAYSDGTPLATSFASGIGPSYAPVFVTTGLIDASGNVLGVFLPKVTDVIATGAGDDVIYTGGANYDTYIAVYAGAMPAVMPGQFVGGVADGVNDKTSGVLVFAGPGDNVIFSGKGADVIVLDDTLGITRVVPVLDSAGHLTFTVSMSNLNGLSYVYNAQDGFSHSVIGGNYSDMFNGNTLNTVQSLITSGHLLQPEGTTDPLLAYTYDIIRPIYDNSFDTSLTYKLSSSSIPLTADAINADHGNNTLVYWKDSVSTDPNSADVVMYFDVTKDKINLTGLFNELAPNTTDAQRLAAIHVIPITSVAPYDVTAENTGGTTVGMDGVRISVTIGANSYQIADLANVNLSDVTNHLSTIFDVHNAPEVP